MQKSFLKKILIASVAAVLLSSSFGAVEAAPSKSKGPYPYPSQQQSRQSSSQRRMSPRQSSAPRPVMQRQKPVTQRPVMQRPKPVAQRPVMQRPKPVAQRAVMERPKPVTQRPVVQKQKPVTTRPVVQKEKPVTARPVVQKQKPVTARPVVQKVKPKTVQPVERKVKPNTVQPVEKKVKPNASYPVIQKQKRDTLQHKNRKADEFKRPQPKQEVKPSVIKKAKVGGPHERKQEPLRVKKSEVMKHKHPMMHKKPVHVYERKDMPPKTERHWDHKDKKLIHDPHHPSVKKDHEKKHIRHLSHKVSKDRRWNHRHPHRRGRYRGYYHGVYHTDVFATLLAAQIIHSTYDTTPGTVINYDEMSADDFIPKEAVKYNGHHYLVFSDIGNSMEDAQKFCESMGGYLATAGDEKKDERLYRLINDSGFDNEYFEKFGSGRLIPDEPVTYQKAESDGSSEEEEYYGFYYWNYRNLREDGTVAGTGGNAFICEWDA